MEIPDISSSIDLFSFFGNRHSFFQTYQQPLQSLDRLHCITDAIINYLFLLTGLMGILVVAKSFRQGHTAIRPARKGVRLHEHHRREVNANQGKACNSSSHTNRNLSHSVHVRAQRLRLLVMGPLTVIMSHARLNCTFNIIRGDHSGCAKSPVDSKTNVALYTWASY